MTWDKEYGEFVDDVSLPTTNNYVYVIGNLAAEAGECAGKFAKAVRDGWDEQKLNDELFYEMGDVLWHIQKWCNMNNTSLEELALANTYKLKDRRKRNMLQGSGDNR